MAGVSAGAQPGPSASSRAPRRAAGIYGTIITAAILAAIGDHVHTLPLTVSILVTLVVYWLAEEYAELLGEQLEGGHLPTWADVRTALAATWPMVTASYIPLLAVILAHLARGLALGGRQRRAGGRDRAADDLRVVRRAGRPAPGQAAAHHHGDRRRARAADDHSQGRGPYSPALSRWLRWPECSPYANGWRPPWRMPAVPPQLGQAARTFAFSRSNSSWVITPRSRRSASLVSWSAVLAGESDTACWI